MDSKKSILLRGAVASILSLAMLGGAAFSGIAANAAEPTYVNDYKITIEAAQADRGGANTLKGRSFTAYKIADYVDGTYVSIKKQDPDAAKQLDGVAVDTPAAIRADLNRVLAKTTGVTDVTKLPGWTESGKDPVSWMGGFKQTKRDPNNPTQTPGNNQASGSFGFGWNESGPQGNGNISPDKAYTGSVREFADNLVKDAAAMAAVKKMPNVSVTCPTDQGQNTCVVPITATQGSGIYLIIDTAGTTKWQQGNMTYTTGTTQPMIVPTKPDVKDMATMPGYKPSDQTELGTTGKLGVIVIKNVADNEVLPPCVPPTNPPTTPPTTPPCTPPNPKQRDEYQNTGKDAADNASDVGDTVPYVVDYRVPDLSAYRNAKDNGRNWIYSYRVIDQTQAGLKIDPASITVKLYPADANLYDGKGKPLPEDQIVDKNGNKITPTVITPTAVDPEPAMPAVSDKSTDATPTGQKGETNEAWYFLKNNDDDHSRLVIGLGKYLVNHYGDLALNDKTKTLYASQIQIRYKATITPKILLHSDMTNNENWLDYSDTPSDVASGSHHETPHTKIKQWTYDIDLHKRATTSNFGLAGAKFTLTVKNNANAADGKKNGTVLKFIPATATKGDYRLATAADTNASTELVTGDDGILRLRGLDLGTYTLTETLPPTHYQQLKSSEDITITAQFEDTAGDFITPNHQTELKYAITQNNRVPVWNQPMFNFLAENKTAGLTIDANKATATWGGKDASGKWYADDKTNIVSADLVLWNRPINVMLAKTGGYFGVGVISFIGALLVIAGVTANIRKRRTTKPADNDLYAGMSN